MNDEERGPLRFAIMCPPHKKFALWQAEAIRRLVESGNGRPVLLIADATNPQTGGHLANFLQRVTRPNALWRVFNALDMPAAMRPVDLSKELEGIPTIRCRVYRRGRFAEYFTDEDVSAIHAHELDFILRFGFGIIKGSILESARFGVWSFHHGDELQYRGGPPYFWEIYNGERIVGAILQRLTEKLDAGVVLRKGFVDILDYSYSRNYNRMLMESASWPTYVAAEIRNGIPIMATARSSVTQAPVRRTPSNLAMLPFLAVLLRNIARRSVARLMREEWNVGIVRVSVEEIVRGAAVGEVKWFSKLSDGWVADPMALQRDGLVHVLCERMVIKSGKAHIAALQFDGQRWSGGTPAIRTGCHASYPYLLETQGQIYCIPETYEANEVMLYRATEFPLKWEKVGTLLRGFPAVDSTVFQHEERWWLFATSPESSGHKLFAWFAPALRGPWLPHRANPIKIDVRSSRPAGPPFCVDGILYRPAQDCSKTYGGRIVLNRVLELTPTRFYEEAASYLEPDAKTQYGKALHTLTSAGNYCVIDGKRWRFRW